MRGLGCLAHKHRSMVPLEDHHIHPLGYHGPNVASNKIRICANAHSDAHYLLERMLKTANHVPAAEKRTYGFMVRRIAQRGYDGVMSYSEKLSQELRGL
jgi:hypothetical protein